MMGLVIAVIAVVVLAALAAAGLFLWRKRPQELKATEYYEGQWKQLQSLLKDKAQWANAITQADKLLDTALKKRHIRGRSMGERLVKAQRLFTDNDGLWFGHKLRNRIDADPTVKLKEAEVKQALLGTRQALKDVGALPDASARNQK
ncbi:MAG TPA: hypothetical protein VLF71_01875 [Candidatus Saccharimonadales bacterium]|nr:hypothetical protein [Candidatus Saccharimonadales bacterium]